MLVSRECGVGAIGLTVFNGKKILYLLKFLTRARIGVGSMDKVVWRHYRGHWIETPGWKSAATPDCPGFVQGWIRAAKASNPFTFFFAKKGLKIWRD